MYRSELRNSQIKTLLERVQKLKFKKYLRSIYIKNARQLESTSITFDFPVTAIIGPNGSGKSTVLALAACSHTKAMPRTFFFYSKHADSQEISIQWTTQYRDQDTLEAGLQTQDLRVDFHNHSNLSESKFTREVRYFGSNRILPPTESPFYMRKRLSGRSTGKRGEKTDATVEVLDFESARVEAEKILGKPLAGFNKTAIQFSETRSRKLRPEEQYFDQVLGVEITHKERDVLVGRQLLFTYQISPTKTISEFNFGAGEASILRVVAFIEEAPEQSLILIEEIENGLHPIAVSRFVEYLVDVADRRRLQVIFTTHSEYALEPLPDEAIWSCLNGKTSRGRLSISSLRAISGRFDTEIVIFCEDKFAKDWIEAIVRSSIPEYIPLLSFHFLGGDGKAIAIHKSHNSDPSITSKSICFLDGDSEQVASEKELIFRLPGESPELEVFTKVKESLDRTVALLTVAFHLNISRQDSVKVAILEISATNRDPHLLYAQIGVNLGMIPEDVIKGAFFSVWCSITQDYLDSVKTTILAEIAKVNPALTI